MKILRKILIIILIVLISISLYFGIKGYDMYKKAIEAVPLEQKISEIRNKKDYIKINEVPKIYKDAVISVEDYRFYKHKGIDIISIGRALINDIKERSFAEGGSTITQQLSKNIYFTQEKKIERKVAEVFMAFKIENKYSKDEILELYINTNYFGDNCYSLKEASKKYYNKEINELTDYENIMIAGIPNAPSVYAPTANSELAKQRQKQVINKMVEYGYMDKEKANSIIK